MSESAPLQLAEVRWTYRRIFTYVVTALAAVLLAVIITRLSDPDALKWVALALVGLIAVVSLLYLAGATATDLARLAAAVKAGASPGGAS